MNFSSIQSSFFDKTTQRAALLEFLGTCVLSLVAFRTGSPLFVGLTLLVFVYVIGDKTGCHINPGVTAGLMAAGRFSVGAGVFYIVMQIFGALLGRFIAALFASPTPGVIVASGGFFAEFFAFALLMLAVSAVTEKHVPQTGSGIAVGGGLTAGLAAAGGILNPAIAIAAGQLFSWGFLMPLIAGPVFAVLYVMFMKGVTPPN